MKETVERHLVEGSNRCRGGGGDGKGGPTEDKPVSEEMDRRWRWTMGDVDGGALGDDRRERSRTMCLALLVSPPQYLALAALQTGNR